MIHIHCPTKKAYILVAFSDEACVLRFPSESGEIPGLALDAKPLVSINEQLMERLARFSKEQQLELNLSKFEIRQDLAFSLKLPDGEDAVLYLGSYVGSYSGMLTQKLTSWSDLSALIRLMPQNRNRLPYLKALQVFSGEVF